MGRKKLQFAYNKSNIVLSIFYSIKSSLKIGGNTVMQQRLAFSSYVAVGVMLFALFFGAGNLIFPATLGQYSGENFIPAIGGFLITGIGMPFLGVLAIGYSGSS